MRFSALYETHDNYQSIPFGIDTEAVDGDDDIAEIMTATIQILASQHINMLNLGHTDDVQPANVKVVVHPKAQTIEGIALHYDIEFKGKNDVVSKASIHLTPLFGIIAPSTITEDDQIKDMIRHRLASIAGGDSDDDFSKLLGRIASSDLTPEQEAELKQIRGDVAKALSLLNGKDSEDGDATPPTRTLH